VLLDNRRCNQLLQRAVVLPSTRAIPEDGARKREGSTDKLKICRARISQLTNKPGYFTKIFLFGVDFDQVPDAPVILRVKLVQRFPKRDCFLRFTFMSVVARLNDKALSFTDVV
jgi:hypothetical protein